jgi:dTDP-glucose pyrophosphorylase
MINKDIFIGRRATVKEALKKLNVSAEKVLLVVNKNLSLQGTITDGDIRRYILRGASLDSDIEDVYNKKPIYIKKKDYIIDSVKKIFIKNKIELIPILDEKNKVIDSVNWDEIFSDDKKKILKLEKIDIPVVIMAGGKGGRLEPFSKILPKALIPIADKPIIEIIIGEFQEQGVKRYYVTLNHKAGMIEAYFNSIERDYSIKYIKEKTFLGTAGSLKLLGSKISDTFIVSNCDVIVKANFSEVLAFHKKQKALLTILTSIQHYKIPYGVVNFKEKGRIVEILEKPEYTFTINTGVYIVDKKCLKFIPSNSFFNMTDLIKKLIVSNRKAFTYLVNENDYIDIGQWEEYKKATEKLQILG